MLCVGEPGGRGRPCAESDGRHSPPREGSQFHCTGSPPAVTAVGLGALLAEPDRQEQGTLRMEPPRPTEPPSQGRACAPGDAYLWVLSLGRMKDSSAPALLSSVALGTWWCTSREMASGSQWGSFTSVMW